MDFTAEQRKAWQLQTRDSDFNLWMRRQVTRSDGTLDLATLHEVARHHGVDPEAYAHLNPGQQRMNIGNRLRRVVPPAEYESGSGIIETGPPPTAASETTPTQTQLPVSSLTGSSVKALLQLHAAVIEELRARGVVRTGNSPLGDFAEYLFSTTFGWTLEGNSTSGHDATDANGVRYQIKARRVTTASPGQRQLSAVRRLPEGRFDVLAGLLLDGHYDVLKAALVPHHVVMARARWIEHVNGWRFSLDDDVWREPGVLDVTPAVRAAIERL